MGKSIFSRAGLITAEDKKDLEKRLEELEQAIDGIHDSRRQQERASARRERAVLNRIDEVERAISDRLDALAAGLSREIASLSRSLPRDLSAFRSGSGIDTSALGTMMQKEIARQMAALHTAQEKGAQDLKDSLALTLQYVASTQEQGFADLLKRHSAIEIGLVETAGQKAILIGAGGAMRFPGASPPSTRRSATTARRRRSASASRTSRRTSCKSSCSTRRPPWKHSQRSRTSASWKGCCACRKQASGRRA